MSAAEEKFIGVIDEGVSSTRFLVYTIYYSRNNIYTVMLHKNINTINAFNPPLVLSEPPRCFIIIIYYTMNVKY